MSGNPTAITSHRHDLPHSLVAIIERCLSKDPARRFPDANALHDALASAREKAAIVVTPLTLVTPAFATPGPSVSSGHPGTPPTLQSPRHSSPPLVPQLPTSTSFGESAELAPAPAPPPRASSRMSATIGLALLGVVVVAAVGVKVVRRSSEPLPTTATDPPPAALVPPPPATAAISEPVPAPTPSPAPILMTAPPTASHSAVPPPPAAKAHHPPKPKPKPTSTPGPTTPGPTATATATATPTAAPSTR
jgi:serine/threonine-protein kinase